MNQFGLLQAVDGLGQRVVIAVALAAHRRLDASFRQSLGVANADVLRASIGVTNQTAIALRLTGIEGLLQGVENKVRAH